MQCTVKMIRDQEVVRLHVGTSLEENKYRSVQSTVVRATLQEWP
jgi:hypothetical protein